MPAPGPLADGTGRYAATWVPREASVPLVWAALDCPGGWSAGIAGRPMVLGTMTAGCTPCPSPVGEAHVVWPGSAARRAASTTPARPCCPRPGPARPRRGDVDRRRPHHGPTQGARDRSPGPAGGRRTAVVTGASSGIGAATARVLARRRFPGRVRGPPGERVEALAAEIDGVAVACDVTDDADVARLGRRGRARPRARQQRRGCAGPRAGRRGRRRAVAADVRHQRPRHARVTKALLPALVAADGEGVVVNVGSMAGFTAYEGGGATRWPSTACTS